MKNRILIPLLTVLLLASASSCKEPEFLVERITIEPDDFEMMVGDFKKVSISTFPHFAANEDMLETYLSDKTIADFDGQTVVAKKEGVTNIIASCERVTATGRLRVYAWKITLEGKEYGISNATGKVTYGGTTMTPRLDISLSHETGSQSQHVDIWISTSELNQTINFLEPIPETAFISAYYNNTENGYAVCAMNSGTPLVLNADWTDIEGDTITLTKGVLNVSHPSGTNKYSIKGEFELSNGFTFLVDWEGTLPVVISD